MNVKRLRLWNQFVARDAVQVFEQLLFFLHAAAQAHAHLRFHAQRSMLVICDGIRHHVNGLGLCVQPRPFRRLHVDAQFKRQLVARHHERIARLLCFVQHAHLHRAAYADAPRAARQFGHAGLARRAEHVADLQPRGQIKFLTHERFILAQRRGSAERDSLFLGAQRILSARRVGHQLLPGGFKRFRLNIQQRAQRHAAAHRCALCLLHGDTGVHTHVRRRFLCLDAVLKITGRFHRPNAR